MAAVDITLTSSEAVITNGDNIINIPISALSIDIANGIYIGFHRDGESTYAVKFSNDPAVMTYNGGAYVGTITTLVTTITAAIAAGAGGSVTVGGIVQVSPTTAANTVANAFHTKIGDGVTEAGVTVSNELKVNDSQLAGVLQVSANTSANDNTNPLSIKICDGLGTVAGVNVDNLALQVFDVNAANGLVLKQTNNPQVDLASILRVSQARLVGSGNWQKSAQGNEWGQAVTGGTTNTWLTAGRILRIRNTTASGDIGTVSTKLYHPYQQGSSQLVRWTCAMKSNNNANVIAESGYFDSNNGVFVRYSGFAWSLVIRTFATELSIPQASWNVDILDGTGGSGFNLAAIYQTKFFAHIDNEANTIQFGVYQNGTPIIAHVHQQQALVQSLLQNASLPVTFQLRNTGASVSTTDLFIHSYDVRSDGGEIPFGKPFGIGYDVATKESWGITAGTKTIATGAGATYLGSLQMKTSLWGASFKPTRLLLGNSSSAGNYIVFTVIRNPISITGAVFRDFNADSVVQADFSATAINIGSGSTASEVIAEIVVAPDSVREYFFNPNTKPLGWGVNLGVGDIISIIGRTQDLSGTPNASVHWEWLESRS